MILDKEENMVFSLNKIGATLKENRFRPALFEHNEFLYACGGKNDSGDALKTCERLDMKKN